VRRVGRNANSQAATTMEALFNSAGKHTNTAWETQKMGWPLALWYHSWKYRRGIQAQCFRFDVQFQSACVKGTKVGGWGTPSFKQVVQR